MSPERILRTQEVMLRTGLGRTTIWRLERSGDFPRRRSLGGSMVGWLESEIDQWIAARVPPEEEKPVDLSGIKFSIDTLPGSVKLDAIGSGLYFLCHLGEVVYVGQSANVAARIAAHHDKVFDAAHMLPLPVAQLNEVEGAMIRLLKPRYNQTAPAGDHARDVRALRVIGVMP